MPYKRKRRYKRKPRTTHKSKKMTLYRRPMFDGAFPNTFIAKFRSSFRTTMSGAAAVQSSFPLNNLNDPGGAQSNVHPPGYDHLLSADGPYIRYRVYKSRIIINCINASATVPVQLAAYLSDDSTSLTSIQDARAQPYCKYGIVDIAGGQSKRTLKLGAKTRQIIGRKNDTDNLANWNTATGPSEKWYCHLMAADIKAASNMDIVFTITIEQWAILSDRFDTPQGTTAT